MRTKKQLAEIMNSIIEVANVEYNYYDLSKKEFIYSSGLAQKVLGYSKKEFSKISSRFYTSIIHPYDKESVLEGIRMIQLSLEGQITETNARFRKADGKYIWVYTRCIVSERNSEGRPSKVFSISEDVTRLMTLQEELMKHVKALDKIAFKNSHEIRGPVSTIMGIINMMEEHGSKNAFDEQLFKYLKTTVHKLDNIILKINELTHIIQ